MMRKSVGISALPKILSVLLVFVVAAAILSVPRYGQNSDGGGGTAGYFVYAEDDTGAGTGRPCICAAALPVFEIY